MARTRALLFVGHQTFELCDRADAEARGRTLRFGGPLDALLWLRRASAATGAATALRRFLAEGAGVVGAPLQSEEDVLRQLASLLAAGRAVVVERPITWLESFGDAADAADPEAPVEPASERRPEAKRTWITIELVGEDDAPIPGERYRIELPDGSVREGRLDARGLARVLEIDPGECVVTFPDLDEAAWTPIRTTSEP